MPEHQGHRFADLRHVATGGQGAVWRGRDTATQRQVAIKIAPAGEHTAAEVALCQAIQAPGMVPITEVLAAAALGLPGATAAAVADQVALVMPWIEGHSLTEALAAMRDDGERRERVGQILVAACTTLEALHRAGFGHFDVASQNIVVPDASSGLPAAVLLDAGLSARLGSPIGVRGTPAFLAPEAAEGIGYASVDLFGLGAAIFYALSGQVPYPGDNLGEILAAQQKPTRRTAAAVAPWLGADLASLIDDLISPVPTGRQFAAVVARRAAAAIDLPLPQVLIQPPTFTSPRSALNRFVDELCESLLAVDRQKPLAWRICGGRHSGARLLVAEALRRYRVRSLEAAHTPRLARWLEATPQLAFAPSEVAIVSLGAIRGPASPPADDVLVATRRLLQRAAADDSYPVIVIDDGDALGHPSFDVDFPIHRVPTTSTNDVAEVVLEMTGLEVSATWAAGLLKATGGRLGHIVEVVTRWDGGAGAALPSVATLLENTDPHALVADRKTSAAYEILEALALGGGNASLSLLSAMVERGQESVTAELSLLVRRGLVELTITGAGVGARVADDVDTVALVESASAARRKKRHRAALAWLDANPGAGTESVSHSMLRLPHVGFLGPRAAAAELATTLARHYSDAGQPAVAMQCWQVALENAESSHRAAIWFELANQALIAGAFAIALDHVAGAERTRDPAVQRDAALLRSQILQRQGRLAEALAAFDAVRPLLATAPAGWAARAHGVLARIEIGLGEYRNALATANAGSARATDAACLENGALASYYLGDLGPALALLEVHSSVLVHTEDQGARMAAIAGMAHQSRGDLPGATAAFTLSRTRYQAAGNPHGVAVADLNIASVDAERGNHAAALHAFSEGIGALQAIGARHELAAAYFNRGNSALHLGLLDQAADDAVRAAAFGPESGPSQAALFADLLRGELLIRKGDLANADALYRRVSAEAEEMGDARAALLAWLQLAVTRAERGHHDALGALDQAAARATTEDDRERLLLALGRVSALLGLPERAPTIEAFVNAANQAQIGGRLDAVWRIRCVASRTAMALGDLVQARLQIDLARTGRELIEAATPTQYHPGMRTDPDARALVSTEAALARQSAANHRDTDTLDASWLHRLLILSRRLNSELRVDRILDDVLDTAIELTRAERGFLLLRDPAGALEIVAARNFGAANLEDTDTSYSRSIAEQAALTGAPVITVDAGDDARFDAAASVALLKLRSVLAVPLRQRGTVTGTIYVDHRYRKAAFDDQAAALLAELADIAALAIANARHVTELATARAKAADLNQRLLEEATDRERELAAARATLATTSREALAHAYPGIIGTSQAIRSLLALVDRAAASDVGVVICGESGTGKELVARALHEHGHRQSGPFVAVNCGALAESLLESELFGHVRGAFTGAERDRAGLFEVASGGTLFLDEIADTSPAMQARLLRVLQEREVRRLGDHEQRPINVRIICASNRRLRELVDRGEFREDLYFRLAVLELDVPPLRNRIDDIAALAHHFLRKDERGAERHISARGLKALAAYHWPGNVRELENRLARARAISDGVIGPEHLDLPATPRGNKHSGEFALRPQVERLERELVEAAMAHADGNQSAAARLLGLSRYGLQKKLARWNTE